MQLRFSLKKGELIEFYLADIWRALRRSLFVRLIFILVFLRALAWGIYALDEKKSFLLCLAVFFKSLFWNFPLAVFVSVAAVLLVKQIAAQEERGYYEERTVILTDHGIEAFYESGLGTRIPFEEIKDITETKNLLLLGRPYTKKESYYFMIPKRVFENEEQLELFRTEIENRREEALKSKKDTEKKRTEPEPENEALRKEEPKPEYEKNIPENGDFSISFFFDEKEWVDVYIQARKCFMRTQSGTKTRLFSKTFFPAVLFVLVLAGMIEEGFSAAFAFGIFFVLVIYLPFRRMLLGKDKKRLYRFLYRRGRLPMTGSGNWKLTVTPQEIYTFCNGIEDVYEIRRLLDYVETQAYIFLFTDVKSFIPIKKSALEETKQQWLKTHLNEKGIKVNETVIR